jgi:hypothetical protein
MISFLSRKSFMHAASASLSKSDHIIGETITEYDAVLIKFISGSWNCASAPCTPPLPPSRPIFFVVSVLKYSTARNFYFFSIFYASFVSSPFKSLKNTPFQTKPLDHRLLVL